jgi:hypothetical protein
MASPVPVVLLAIFIDGCLRRHPPFKGAYNPVFRGRKKARSLPQFENGLFQNFEARIG